jgi:hypothetical protein
MTVRTINLQLPDAIYQRLQRVANATNQPIEEVLIQTIRGNLPPSLDDLAPEFRDIVADLQHLNDDELWTIAKSALPSGQWRRHQQLLDKLRHDALTVDEQQELTNLRTATDRFVLRRSYALALLKWHGHTLPVHV